jgi:hypothetical protein
MILEMMMMGWIGHGALTVIDALFFLIGAQH